jgi:osmoprotectant transport system ATP-binding protein
MASLALEGVQKSFEGRDVLSPTTFTVADGERVALIGPSGSGKSTLLRMIIGLVVPDAGRVRVGELVVTPATFREARARVGWMPQDGGLFPHLTAAENVTLVARLRGRAPARNAERLAELADLVRVSSALLARHPRRLSGGERQRVALMRALFLEPDVVLLDEPLGALDPLVRARLQDDLRAVFDALKKTVVFVTHDLAEAALLAQSMAVVYGGTIVQRGAMRELRDAPAHPFVEQLLGAQRTLADALA